MAGATSTVTIRQIITVIKRFKFKELETAVMPCFPEISWTHLRSELVKQHAHFTVANIIRIFEIALTDARLPEKVLQNRLSTLETIDISRHSTRKIWYGYALIGPKQLVKHVGNREIEQTIKDQFRVGDIDATVRIITHNGVTYISLKEPKRRSKSHQSLVTHFAIFLGQKCFFCTKKGVSNVMINLLINSLGFNSSRKLRLSGRDLKSLSTLCWKRKQGALNAENISKPPIYKEAPPTVKNTGVDFTQLKQRKHYAENCFGTDTATLELLTLNGQDQIWTSDHVSKKLAGNNIDVKWEFRSRNVLPFLTELIARRVLITPVPSYIADFTKLGANEFTVKTDI